MATNVLPQLNVTDFEPQIFWLLIIFFFFYLVVKVKIVPYFDLETENRDKKISNNYQDAKKLKYKAERLAHDYREKIQAVHLRANDLISEAKASSARRLEDEKKRLNSELTANLNLEMQKIQKEYEGVDTALIGHRDMLKDQAVDKLISRNDDVSSHNLGVLL